jgi:hypothetical protein
LLDLGLERKLLFFHGRLWVGMASSGPARGRLGAILALSRPPK